MKSLASSRSALRLRFAALVGLGIALAGASTTASAATVSLTDAFSIDTTTSGAPSSVGLKFAQFDPNLGSLTGISVQLTGNADAVLTFINNSTTSESFSGGKSTTSLGVTGTGLSTMTSSTLSSPSFGTLSGTINASPTAGQFAYTYFAGPQSAVNLFGSVASGSFGAYVGSGAMTLNYDVLTTGFSASSSMASFASAPSPYFIGVGGAGQAVGQVTVTYTYTPVPLPAAAWLIVSGLGSLCAFARKRKGP